MKHACLTLLSLLIAACAAMAPASNDSLNGLIIRNQTDAIIYNVKLHVQETGGVIACSSILPNTECSVRFDELENKHYHTVLSWEHHGKSYTKPLIGKQTELPHHTQPFEAVIEVKESGQLDVFLQ